MHYQSLCRKESEKLDIILDSAKFRSLGNTVGRKCKIRQHSFGLLISAGQAAGGAGPVLGQGGGGAGPVHGQGGGGVGLLKLLIYIVFTWKYSRRESEKLDISLDSTLFAQL
jgi:hypothetical protein